MIMGREVMRVPMGFDWPINKIWPGKMISICGLMEDYYKNESHDERCALCKKYATLSGFTVTTYGCPDFPFSDPPKGDWYQLWETTSEGSPISPSFETPEELAHWLEDNKASAMGYETASYDQWLAFIKGPGWAPSMVICDGKMMSGVQGIMECK
jgi:hypothetical protein